jgi:hypothetical protein
MVEAMEFGEKNLWLMMYGWNWRCVHIHMALVQLDRQYLHWILWAGLIREGIFLRYQEYSV